MRRPAPDAASPATETQAWSGRRRTARRLPSRVRQPADVALPSRRTSAWRASIRPASWRIDSATAVVRARAPGLRAARPGVRRRSPDHASASIASCALACTRGAALVERRRGRGSASASAAAASSVARLPASVRRSSSARVVHGACPARRPVPQSRRRDSGTPEGGDADQLRRARRARASRPIVLALTGASLAAVGPCRAAASVHIVRLPASPRLVCSRARPAGEADSDRRKEKQGT